MENPLSLQITIRARTGILYQGTALSVTAANSSGVFDVLPQHANFISLIEGDISLQNEAGEQQSFTSKKGILRVKDNTVNILIEN